VNDDSTQTASAREREDPLIQVLYSLADRIDNGGDITPAVTVIGDIGRMLAVSPERQVRYAQAAVAAVRETIERLPGSQHSAVDWLGSSDATAYFAGALWAANEIQAAYLEARQPVPVSDCVM